jgi:hypothetical protein
MPEELRWVLGPVSLLALVHSCLTIGSCWVLTAITRTRVDVLLLALVLAFLVLTFLAAVRGALAECLREPGKAASFYSVALGTAPVGCAVRPSRFLLIAVHGTG